MSVKSSEAAEPVVEVEGLHHYTISVADLDEATHWYSRVLGFRAIYRYERHPWGRLGYMLAPGFLLEIFEVPDPRALPLYAAGPEPDVDLAVCGHKHLALQPDSVAEAERALELLGEKVLSFKPLDLGDAGEILAAFIADSTGALIELLQEGVAPVFESGGALGPGPLKIASLHHVAVSVPDREEAVKWYKEVFGLSVAGTSDFPAIGLRTAMMQGPGFWLELHCMAGSAPVPSERRDPRADVQTLGNKYFALGVKDATEASKRLEAAGVSVIATEAMAGARRVFISDNSGNPIELFQIIN